MIAGLGTQVREFLFSGVLGLGLSLCYDWGRAHRRVFPKLTFPVDMLFALLFFLCLMLLSIYTRGLKLYQLLGLGLGAALYFLALSSWILRPLLALLGKIRGLGNRAANQKKKIINFLRKLQKKLFPSSGKWSTIDVIPFLPKGKSTGKRGANPGDEKYSPKGHGCRHGGLGRMDTGRSGKRSGRRTGAEAGAGRSHRRDRAGA